MLLSIVIPAYNEAENIDAVLKELLTLIPSVEAVTQFEMIVVDDHSSDKTFEIVSGYNHPAIKAMRLSRRSGSHVALRCGLSAAQGDAVLCLSADGQDNPGILHQMVNQMLQGTNVVWAVRDARNDEPFWQRVFSNLFYRILNILVGPGQVNFNATNADFYLLDRRVVNAINACSERNTSLFGLILWLGFRQDFVTYTRRKRHSGGTKWSMRSRMRLAKDWIIAFSGIPLKMITAIGIVTSILGFLYAFFIIIYSLLGYASPGWAETVIFILVLGGIQMTMLGVIGEYLWRTLDETRKRPLFFVEKNSTSINT